ncbi:MAG: cytochrome c3 family protein [Proteobacteria bacterium]|nr:cytochrome c3 family protein [Pseudomonadota bacterium]MBU1611258.1 cytochrome c3 family protein [Pseudomonadota bacterium]
MKRLTIIILACISMLCIATVALAVAPAPKDPVEMKFPADGNKYAPIMFVHHDRHLAVEGSCATCHHKWDGASAVTGCSVEGCHSDVSKENKKNPESYDSAFHSRTAPNSCVNCHTVTLKADPASKAPKKCNDCHTKKNG